MSPPAWQRSPPSVPTVYHRYTGPKDMPDGRKPNFWIQDATPDRYEEIVDFMCDSFLKEEPLCAISGLREDPVSLAEFRDWWGKILRKNAVLVALTDWPDGPAKLRVAGCNMTFAQPRGNPPSESKGVATKKVVDAMHALETRMDLYDVYGVDVFLSALGLSVGPPFRGQDLGRQLLLAREPLCRALGLNLAVTVFSSVGAQRQSQRAGYDVVAEVRYDEYKEDGEVVFPGVPNDVMQLKVKKIE